MLEQVSFEGKNEGEVLLVFTRRHWFVLFSITLGTLFAAFLPLVLIVLFAPLIVAYEAGSAIFLFCWFIYIMILWFILIYQYTIYSLDTWIVTNERVLDIVQIGFFNRKVSELHLDSIQDISVNTNGFIQSYLTFGNVEIQTAATSQRFLFDRVPHPLAIKDAIMNAANARKDRIHGSF